ncbi:MAG: TIGR04211 family SH3 domain-containing protein [Thermodesulfobacteriota bacterium]
MMILSKRNFYLFLIAPLFLFIFVAQTVWADTRYVSDRLIISMREGRSPQDTAVAFLVAGTPVEVLEEADNYLFVRIANGQEGWVRTKYILTQLPKPMVIKELKVKVEELENQIETMQTLASSSPGDSADIRNVYELKLKNLEAVLEKEKKDAAATRTELKEIKDRNKKLQADVNRISEQNATLSQQDTGSDALKNEIKTLRQTNRALTQEINQMETAEQPSMLPSAIKWFLTGGGVLLLGLFLGRSVPRKNPYGY